MSFFSVERLSDLVLQKNCPPKRRRSNRVSTCQAGEVLESREMKTAVTTSLSSSGTLTVRGTDGDDDIEVKERRGEVHVHVGYGSHSIVYEFDRSEVRRLRIYGYDGNDRLDNDLSLDSYISGGNGNDNLYGANRRDTLVGGNGNDRLYGMGGNDYLYGNEGRDYLYGRSGSDRLYGGDDRDFLYGDEGNDRLFGGDGNDTLYGGDDDDHLEGEMGRDYLIGDDGDDTLKGGDGRDYLYGRRGDDHLDGGDDDDKLWGSSGEDILDGGYGDDILDGGADNDKLYGHWGDDTLRGGTGNDRLYGEGGDDKLYGDEGRDYLSGLYGDDVLFGGIGGSDQLRGGTGNDRFLQWKVDTGSGLRPEDVVLDFRSNDAIIGFANGNREEFNFSNGQGATVQAGEFRDREIERIDETLGLLQERTGNTRLLKLANGDDFTIYRLGRQTDGDFSVGAVNRNGDIYLPTVAFSDLQDTIVHEIAHNWDTPGETSWVRGFRAISGWTNLSNPFAAVNIWQSGNVFTLQQAGNGSMWFHNRNATFSPTTMWTRPDGVRDNYGKFNPKEDVATMWEQYFQLWSTGGESAVLNSGTATQAKLDSLNDFFESMS